MKRSLLLNSDWTPLNFVSDVRAFNLVYRGRAEVVSITDGPSEWIDKIGSVSKQYKIPATIRLKSRISRRWHSAAPRFKKWVLFNRDEWKCQYCGVKLEWKNITVDHVVPRCMGGQTSWSNCVVACKPCNHKKGSKLLSDVDMKLAKKPMNPSINHFWDLHRSSTSWHADWDYFFTNPQ